MRLILIALTVLVSAITMTLNVPPVGIGSFRLRDTDGGMGADQDQ